MSGVRRDHAGMLGATRDNELRPCMSHMLFSDKDQEMQKIC